MNELEKSRIQEITSLHAEIGGYLKMTLDKAIRIGELLTEQKAELKHGEWTPWLKKNISFTSRTARNYMMLYANKERLKTETISDLTKTYKLLTQDKFAKRRGVTLEELRALKRIHKNDFEDFLLDYAKKNHTRIINDEVKVPENWNYDKSVKKVKGLLNELRLIYEEL